MSSYEAAGSKDVNAINQLEKYGDEYELYFLPYSVFVLNTTAEQ